VYAWSEHTLYQKKKIFQGWNPDGATSDRLGGSWGRTRGHWTASGVNFTNTLGAAFTSADPKSTKNTVKLSVFFVLLGSVSVKARRKMLVKSTPACYVGWERSVIRIRQRRTRTQTGCFALSSVAAITRA